MKNLNIIIVIVILALGIECLFLPIIVISAPFVGHKGVSLVSAVTSVLKFKDFDQQDNKNFSHVKEQLKDLLKDDKRMKEYKPAIIGLIISALILVLAFLAYFLSAILALFRRRKATRIFSLISIFGFIYLIMAVYIFNKAFQYKLSGVKFEPEELSTSMIMVSLLKQTSVVAGAALYLLPSAMVLFLLVKAVLNSRKA